jgi:pilus assembly protein CpaE
VRGRTRRAPFPAAMARPTEEGSMHTQSNPVGISTADPDSPTQPGPATGEPFPAAMAYLHDAESESTVRRCFADLGYINGQVVHGDVNTAIEELPKRGWPQFLIVDISGIADPLSRISRLAEIGNPETEVIAVGARNDIVLYRDLKAAGVAEYFYKPLVGSLLGRLLVEINSGTRDQQPSRGGKMVFILGVHGGVGATTIATNLAWYFAEARRRGVLLLDLDLQCGDAALQLDAQPGHALCEALDDPRRIDELFLDRGVVPVTGQLGLLAGLEPLSEHVVLREAAVLQLLQKLLAHYRYVVVDLPIETALSLPGLLHLPSSLLLVSDGTLASTREVGRWREFLGPTTADRELLHVLNKKNADGALPEEEARRVIPPPDVSIRWDREIMSAAALGTKAVQECGAISDAMAALSRQLSGGAAEQDASLWKRIFG